MKRKKKENAKSLLHLVRIIRLKSIMIEIQSPNFPD